MAAAAGGARAKLMTTIALLIVSALAFVAGVWPIAVAGVILALLAGGAQSVDDKVAAEAEASGGGSLRFLALILTWVIVGIAGVAVLGIAIGEVLP